MVTPTYDMAAAVSDRRPPSRYVEYLNAYTRLRRAPTEAARSNAAGLLCGSRLHGRETPLKGKGCPPPDNREGPAMVGGLKMVAGHSAKETDPFHTARPITSIDLLFRPSVRQHRSAFVSSMTGTGAVFIDDGPTKRPIRKAGNEAPADQIAETKTRILVDACPVDVAEEWAQAKRLSSKRGWHVPSRPVNADSIIRHRYSDPGTEPVAPKLEAGRAPGPQVEAACPAESKTAFETAANGYVLNKCKALYGSTYSFN